MSSLQNWPSGKLSKSKPKWSTLVPTKVVASSGADLNTISPTARSLYQGKKEVEEYEFSAASSLDKITAVQS
jgi:hypothetical protein